MAIDRAANWRRIRRSHDPDNVVLKQQELSLVDGFSLSGGPGGTNTQLRRAINLIPPKENDLCAFKRLFRRGARVSREPL